MFYNRGINSFLGAKSLDPKKTVALFITHMERNFKATNIHKSVALIEENWNRFATFVDKALTEGTLKGNRVPTYDGRFEEMKRENEERRAEYGEETAEVRELFAFMQKHDPFPHISLTMSFFAKRGYMLPANDQGKVSRIGKSSTKLQYILDSGYQDELKEYLLQKTTEKQTSIAHGTLN